MRPDDDRVDTIVQTVRYTSAISYWRDEDHGHWEEDLGLHTSSIGSVVAGLRSVHRALPEAMEKAEVDLDDLQRRGLDRVLASLPYERYGANYRMYDAAQLLLVEPLQVLGGRAALAVVRDVGGSLMRRHGFARYEGDTYWGHGLPKSFHSASGRHRHQGGLKPGICWRKESAVPAPKPSGRFLIRHRPPTGLSVICKTGFPYTVKRI